MADRELDYMEYANDGLAQAAYVASDSTNFQSYSEGTIKTQGDYALKAIAILTEALNDTLTRTVSPTISLAGVDTMYFDIKQSNPAGSIKVGIHDSGGTTTEKTVTVAGHAITFVGTAALDTAAYKWGTASLLLDGDSDYLTVPDSADWDICGSSSDDWTIDFWVKHADHAGLELYIDQYENDTNYWNLFHLDGSGIKAYILINSPTPSIALLSSSEITDTNWHHIAIIKVATLWGLYLDGTQIAYDTTTDTDTFAKEIQIGRQTAGYYLNGHMDEIRIQHSNVFGAAPNDTPDDTIDIPTGAHTGDANTKLLLHLDGADEAVATVDSSRDYWQTITWDISGVSNANKDVIDSIIITVLNADYANAIYIDNMYAPVAAAVNFMLGCNF